MHTKPMCRYTTLKKTWKKVNIWRRYRQGNRLHFWPIQYIQESVIGG